ncbi:GMC family oxidoreductase N-terminal domain-containing protein [Jiangella sp. DSM 45060]|uniref:GMC family oxidoreductase N-terminal domain-containing protein n=1 Tax=Jiangella sp. DSM 45060 TaxID=1798224 RepID=UPI0008796BDB|nr:GMC family oxidoreductase N-terminal domain-containing protein [Jiangella sp. DSM 45060]SDS76474.1 Choline dehydrogenase [Jiangella sp. DSM 45060]
MRDVIVIGAGGGGPVVAKELAARGLDVLILEAGPRHADPDRDWTHYENDANNPLTGFLRFGPADREAPAWYRETPQNSFIWQLSGVGGTTQHYFGNCPRAYPGVFAGYDGADRDAYDTAHLFPFAYEELVPYFEWVEATLPVQTAAMGTKEQVFFRGCEGIGLPVQTTKTTTEDSFRPQENAILQPGGFAGRVTGRDDPRLRYPSATGCTFCGYCMQGCSKPAGAPRNLAAKRSTDNSYVPMALTAPSWAAGGRAAELIADAVVTRIHTSSRGGVEEASGVTWRVGATGETHREDARVVVLAAGCTESPRLWLNSRLPNPNDWVGRGYTDHFFDWVIGLFDEDTGSTRGAASAARAEFPGRGGMENVGLTPGLQQFAAVFSDSGIRGHYSNGRGPAGPWDGAAGRMIGPELKDALMNGVDRLLNILVITDDDVEAQNRVTLSALPADEHGPVPKVAFHQRKRSARTLRNREFVARRAAETLRAAGARKVVRVDWPPLLLHVQSSMRMGASPDDSVLDAHAEARWVKRLFVADNSALANSLGGPNPTLTSQALATRTAEKIFQTYFGGDPWVHSESPVESTDARVTDGLRERSLA